MHKLSNNLCEFVRWRDYQHLQDVIMSRLNIFIFIIFIRFTNSQKTRIDRLGSRPKSASERLGHSSTATTQQYYRNKPTVVLPLPHRNQS